MYRIGKELDGKGKIAFQFLKQNFIAEDLGEIISCIVQGADIIKREDTIGFVMDLRPELDINMASIVAWNLDVFESEAIEKLTEYLADYNWLK